MKVYKKILVRLGCAVFIFAIGTAILYPVFKGGRPYYGSCQSNLKQIGLCMMQYAQDHDGKYPLVMASDENFGWAGTLQTYLKNTQILKCPRQDVDKRMNDDSSVDDGTRLRVNPRSVGYTDYWYNERLQVIGDKEFVSTAITILSGDGNDGRDATTARYSLRSLLPEWLTDKSSPCHRHPSPRDPEAGARGSNFLFLDGHTKWFQPEKIEPTMTASVSKGGPTFAFQ